MAYPAPKKAVCAFVYYYHHHCDIEFYIARSSLFSILDMFIDASEPLRNHLLEFEPSSTLIDNNIIKKNVHIPVHNLSSKSELSNK